MRIIHRHLYDDVKNEPKWGFVEQTRNLDLVKIMNNCCRRLPTNKETNLTHEHCYVAKCCPSSFKMSQLFCFRVFFFSKMVLYNHKHFNFSV